MRRKWLIVAFVTMLGLCLCALPVAAQQAPDAPPPAPAASKPDTKKKTPPVDDAPAPKQKSTAEENPFLAA